MRARHSTALLSRERGPFVFHRKVVVRACGSSSSCVWVVVVRACVIVVVICVRFVVRACVRFVVVVVAILTEKQKCL